MKLLSGQTSRSYSHRLRASGAGDYIMSWVVDTKHGRIRYPHVRERRTDEKGARRFAKKWGISWPPPWPAR